MIQIDYFNRYYKKILKKEREFYEFWKEYTNRPFTARNILLKSLCPQLYGMYIVKMAVTLVRSVIINKYQINNKL
jgi:hypothetical protein